ncbi:hypothetical protein MHB42_16685 [Lysinibacillus sp. FSL K6-0232]|uniref:hypothetical protein n=1 Tax=unclassified Lysinibacillus TaxID=2636778 RepID=UPI0030FC704C
MTHVTCGEVLYANTTNKNFGDNISYKLAYVKGDNFSLGGDSGGAVYVLDGLNTNVNFAGVVTGNRIIGNAIIGGWVTKYQDVQPYYGISLHKSSSNVKVN